MYLYLGNDGGVEDISAEMLLHEEQGPEEAGAAEQQLTGQTVVIEHVGRSRHQAAAQNTR